MEAETTQRSVKLTSLAAKLLAIAGDLHRLPKNGFNSFHNYNYVLESDAMEAFSKLCVKHKIMVIPSAEIVGKEGDLTETKTTYTMLDLDSGELVQTNMPGQGYDKGGDKGVYKSLSGSYKYFILKTFMVPSGDDPERDEVSSGPRPQQAKENRSQGNLRTPRGKSEGVLDVHRTAKEKESTQSDIIDRLMDLAGGDGQKIGDLLEASSEWRDDNGKLRVKGVRDPAGLKYEPSLSKDGTPKKFSQAEIVLRKLNDLKPDSIDAELEAWQQLR